MYINYLGGKMIKHRHHKLPRHAGGTDDPENLEELTIEEHAEAHHKLWEKYRRKEDWLAWRGLSGLIGRDELLRELHHEVGRRMGKSNLGRRFPGRGKGRKWSDEMKQHFSEIKKGKKKAPFSESHRRAIGEGHADKTVYTFAHKKTEEVFVGTRSQLIAYDSKVTRADLANLLTGRSKSVKKWTIAFVS
jgi:hypothetical protein